MVRRSLAALLLLLAAPFAHAVFHLWTMEELYSNADGTVQFLELRSLSSGQQFVGQHQLTSSSGSQTRTFTFPADLPGDSGSRRMLVGTAGFAALGVVTPDYVVPNGFFFQGGGTVNFAGADVWNHGALPTNGTLSLLRDGSTATNSPRNFMGQTGTIVPQTTPAPAFNFQSLWWRDPPESESGWGLNIAHQGDILFVTWFTYDLDGSQLWLVMTDARRTATNRYEGPIYRTTGPAFNSTPWDRTRVAVTQVGTGVLAFTNADTGTFTWTINGESQVENITRQVYSSPVSICAPNGTPNPNGNFQDLWWGGESESGWGVNITHQGDILFATWFTYDATGRGQWIVMTDGRRAGAGIYDGALYRTTGHAYNAIPWDRTRVTVTQVGTGRFTFSGPDNGTFQYTVNGVTQTKSITRQVFTTPITVCR